MKSSWLLVLLAALPLAAAAEERGPRIDYILECQGCHLDSGAGRPPDVPRLTDRVGWFLQISGGREYLVQVPGSANAPITDAALAEVLNFMIEKFAGPSMPESFVRYTEEEVARLRPVRPLDIDATRHRLTTEVARFE